MALTPEIETQILRFYHVEKWRLNTIAVQLGVHHTTVQRVLAQAGLPRPGPPVRPSAVDPYVGLIVETLRRFPRLTASRLFVMARERGFAGSATTPASTCCASTRSATSPTPTATPICCSN
jgi:hypothetical protein